MTNGNLTFHTDSPIYQAVHSTELIEKVSAEIRIQQTYETIVDFTLSKVPYTFTITKWKTRGLARLISLFHSMTCAPYNDQISYGSTDYQGVLSVNFDQKKQLVLRATQDVLSCVNQILTKHGKSVLDYAIHRREHVPAIDDYPTYITTIACHCIIHSNFLAPSAQWEEIVFESPPVA